MDFDLRQLEIYCRVVEHGSFTRAAKEVHLAQASVSERVANLERSVGAQLLDRMGRRVEPTVIGRRLYERAVELLEKKQAICFELQELLGVAQGPLVIGASTIPGDVILPGEIARFREDHPDALIRVRGGDSAQVAALVESGEVELGFVGSRRPHDSLRFQELWADELVLAVPAGHRWAGRRRIRLSQVAKEPFVLREPGSGTRQTTEQAIRDTCDGAELPLHVVAELGSTAAIKQAVLQGLGISVLSHRALRVEIDAGLIHTLRIERFASKRYFYLVHDSRRARSPLCRCFEEFVLGSAHQA
ncbi:MAG: selenium metabolism-associated LysR family transcriptional regulator [bacterium]